MPDLLSAKEVAKRLARSERFVLDELRRKNLRGARFGAGWRVAESDLETYIEAHMNVRPVRSADRVRRGVLVDVEP